MNFLLIVLQFELCTFWIDSTAEWKFALIATTCVSIITLFFAITFVTVKPKKKKKLLRVVDPDKCVNAGTQTDFDEPFCNDEIPQKTVFDTENEKPKEKKRKPFQVFFEKPQTTFTRPKKIDTSDLFAHIALRGKGRIPPPERPTPFDDNFQQSFMSFGKESDSGTVELKSFKKVSTTQDDPSDLFSHITRKRRGSIGSIFETSATNKEANTIVNENFAASIIDEAFKDIFSEHKGSESDEDKVEITKL